MSRRTTDLIDSLRAAAGTLRHPDVEPSEAVCQAIARTLDEAAEKLAELRRERAQYANASNAAGALIRKERLLYDAVCLEVAQLRDALNSMTADARALSAFGKATGASPWT
jgi:predicted component of type VI protein secretion system